MGRALPRRAARPRGRLRVAARALRAARDGQVALATYQYEADADHYTPITLDVLTLRGTQIVDGVDFRDSGLFRASGCLRR